jgi:hypothetical protein
MIEHVGQINPELASMQTIVVEKEKLLSILKENKEKHDIVYDIAVSGYWSNAKLALEKKSGEFNVAMAELKDDIAYQFTKFNKQVDDKRPLADRQVFEVKFRFSSYLDLVYPENHTNDYERAIRKVELSVYDKVQLAENEFEQYVLNNWQWRGSFLNTNTPYVTGALQRGEYVMNASMMKHLPMCSGLARSF